MRRAFTIVELIVVIGIISVLMGLLLPALSGVREHSGETACASNLKQLGQATLAYLAAYNDHLPQVTATNPFTGEPEIIGALFGGKRGELAFFGINEYGADRRPLNKFLGGSYRADLSRFRMRTLPQRCGRLGVCPRIPRRTETVQTGV